MSHSETTWYIVNVFRGYEKRICEETQQDLNYKIFYPKNVKVIQKNQTRIKVLVPLFPGYIFIETSQSYESFFDFYSKVFRPLEGVVKVLKHKDLVEALWLEEKRFIQSLMNQEDIIEASKGLKEDDRVIITEGPLMGKESQIIKIDRHKRIAYLAFELFGQKQVIALNLEVLSKQV